VKNLEPHAGAAAIGPGKTFIGKIDKGFDFLGYHFARSLLTIAGSHVDESFAWSRRKL